MKTYTVIISAKALEDVKSISDYIIETYDNQFNAKIITDKILAKCSRLSVFSKASTVKLIFLGKNFRFTRSGKYTIVYYIDEENSTVHISRVLYSRRDIQSIIKEQT